MQALSLAELEERARSAGADPGVEYWLGRRRLESGDTAGAEGAFESALRAVFPSVTLLMQNRTECIAFYPHKVFLKPEASLESTAGAPKIG